MWWKCGGREGVMISSRWLLNLAVGFHTYIWVDVFLIKETPKAILVLFNGRRVWLPKIWILRIKRIKNSDMIKIKISEDNWTRKF